MIFFLVSHTCRGISRPKSNPSSARGPGRAHDRVIVNDLDCYRPTYRAVREALVGTPRAKGFYHALSGRIRPCSLRPQGTVLASWQIQFVQLDHPAKVVALPRPSAWYPGAQISAGKAETRLARQE